MRLEIKQRRRALAGPECGITCWRCEQAMVRTGRLRWRTAPSSCGLGIGAPDSLKNPVGRAAPVSRMGAVSSRKPGARVQRVSDMASRGGPPSQVCLRGAPHRQPGAAGCLRSGQVSDLGDKLGPHPQWTRLKTSGEPNRLSRGGGRSSGIWDVASGRRRSFRSVTGIGAIASPSR